MPRNLVHAVSAVYHVFLSDSRFLFIGIDLFSIADFHADFYYLFQIVERTWTPPSTEGDKNKSRKRLHLRCRIGTFLFCFPCIETSTAAASSSPARRPAVLTALPSSLLLSQPCLHFGRQPQHSSYELVPADVIRQIKIEFSGVLLGIIYICKSTTILQNGQIYFVDLPLCIRSENIAETYSQVVFQ